jgi:hypothetical protein
LTADLVKPLTAEIAEGIFTAENAEKRILNLLCVLGG